MSYSDHRDRTRDGFALPVALMAMIVIGAIVTGGFYASSQENRISASTDLGSQAFYIAEYGLGEVLGTWNNMYIDTVQPGLHPSPDNLQLSPRSVFSSGRHLGDYTISVRRIGAQLFLVTSEGRVHQGQRQGVRRVATMVRTTRADMPYPSALSIFGSIAVGGNSKIRGEDAGGPECEVGEPVAAVTAQHDTLVSQSGNAEITGEPNVQAESELSTDTLSHFGDMSIDDLIAAATKVYEANENNENNMAPTWHVTENGDTICDTSVRKNWGNASGAGPCRDEFPIIHAKGDLSLQTGKGQGILIVDGDLSATGNFEFFGVIIVRGTLKTAGTGNHLVGSVIVMGDGELTSESTSTGNSLVQFSECRVKRAFTASLRPRPVAKRSWLDLSAATRAAL